MALQQLEVTVTWKVPQANLSVTMATVPTGNGSAYLGSGAVLPGGVAPGEGGLP